MNNKAHLLLELVRVGDRREGVFALGGTVHANRVVDRIVLLVLREHQRVLLTSARLTIMINERKMISSVREAKTNSNSYCKISYTLYSYVSVGRFIKLTYRNILDFDQIMRTVDAHSINIWGRLGLTQKNMIHTKCLKVVSLRCKHVVHM